MGYSDQFFRAIGADPDSKSEVSGIAKKLGIPVARLKYYNKNNIVPTGKHLEAIESVLGIGEFDLMLKMGRLDHSLIEAIQNNADKRTGTN